MQFNLRFNIYSNSLTQTDKKVKLRTRIFRFPDARVWGKHSAWTSTASGGARLAPSLRSRWDNIGQKPEPTIRMGKRDSKGSLWEGAGAEGD